MWNGIVRFILITSLISAAGIVVFCAAFLWNQVEKQNSLLVGFSESSDCEPVPDGTIHMPSLTVQRRLEVIVRAEIAHRCDARLVGAVEERNGEVFLIAMDSSEHQSGSMGSLTCRCEKTLVYRLKATGIKKPGTFVLMIGDKVAGRVKES